MTYEEYKTILKTPQPVINLMIQDINGIDVYLGDRLIDVNSGVCYKIVYSAKDCRYDAVYIRRDKFVKVGIAGRSLQVIPLSIDSVFMETKRVLMGTRARANHEVRFFSKSESPSKELPNVFTVMYKRTSLLRSVNPLIK